MSGFPLCSCSAQLAPRICPEQEYLEPGSPPRHPLRKKLCGGDVMVVLGWSWTPPKWSSAEVAREEEGDSTKSWDCCVDDDDDYD